MFTLFRPKSVHPLKTLALLALSVLLLWGGAPALAAKKDKKDAGPDPAQIEAEIKKSVDPLDKTLSGLMTKLQSRQLFSPQDAGKLGESKYKLFDLIGQYPTSPLVVKPAYQGGVLLAERGEYEDAYQLLNFIVSQQPQSPYAFKARTKLLQVEKQLDSNTLKSLQQQAAAMTAPPAADAGKKPEKK